MKITEALLAEHAVFHNLFDHLEQTVPRLRTLAEVKALADVLKALLDAHAQTEDDLIVAPLEHCFEQIGQNDTFHEEHEEIDENLELAQKARQIRTARRFLMAAVMASRHHFDKEERIVFPLAERVLKSKTLTELGAAWMEQRKAFIEQTFVGAS